MKTREREYILDTDQADRLGHVSRLAVLDKAERDALGDMGEQVLGVTLYDRLNQTRHEARIEAACEDPFDHFDGEDVAVGWALQAYFYRFHYCPCHRASGAGVPDEGCVQGRWLVEQITHPALPGVVLYSEQVV